MLVIVSAKIGTAVCLAGQQVFLKYGLMENGTIWGHGAYLGPDFAADYLHTLTLDAQEILANQMYQRQWITRRMLQQLGLQELQAALDELMELLAALGMSDETRQQLRAAMQGNAEALADQVNDYAGQQIAENMAQEYEKRPPLDDLLHRPV